MLVERLSKDFLHLALVLQGKSLLRGSEVFFILAVNEEEELAVLSVIQEFIVDVNV